MGVVDVTVVGGGPVGLFAAFYAGIRGMTCRIVDSLPQLGGQLVALYPEKYVYDVAGFPKVRAKELAAGFVAQGLQFGAEVVTRETASSLRREGEGWMIGTDSGLALPTKTVILSAGAGAFSPTKLGAGNEAEMEGRGLQYGVQDTEALRERDVLVVGGGDSAFDWAIHLHGIASQVRLLHRRDEFRAHEETVRQARDLGIELVLWKSVVSVLGDDVVTGVRVKDHQGGPEDEIACDAIVVNIGFKSNLGPIRDWGLEIEKNQIVVDHLQRTNLTGVFAAGDVCTREGKLKLIATGAGEAATAVCVAKTVIDPDARLFPGHSSDIDVDALRG
ncbi:MAG: NAD(P)/FAD-dependent oxidoreductase [Fimbriimonadaceae bacterium]|nr:NAD(P)/FAD-dependent oxidoreductase [Fimbriimonadaceae bacterium]